MPVATQTYYEILGIDKDASPEEVATARRGMLKAVHPDLALSEEDRLEREHLSRMVNDICDTLLDPLARYDYDRGLAEARRWADAGPDAGPSDEQGPDDDAWQASADPRFEEPVDQHLLSRLPGLERLERWLTWRVAGLALLMLFVSVYLYDTIGGRLLDRIGLHFGRFGSLAVVLVGTVLLVALCLGVARAIRALRKWLV